MPALNFQKQFADKVESGEKRQTIRAMRKRPFKTGDKLYLYYGMRTKSCRKLGEAVCNSVEDVKICKNGVIYINGVGKWFSASYDKIAREDGFKDWNEMFNWFKKTHGLPFHGQLIKW